MAWNFKSKTFSILLLLGTIIYHLTLERSLFDATISSGVFVGVVYYSLEFLFLFVTWVNEGSSRDYSK